MHVVEKKHAAGMKGPLFHFISKILLIHFKFTVKLSCKSVLPAVSGSFIFFLLFRTVGLKRGLSVPSLLLWSLSCKIMFFLKN